MERTLLINHTELIHKELETMLEGLDESFEDAVEAGEIPADEVCEILELLSGINNTLDKLIKMRNILLLRE